MAEDNGPIPSADVSPGTVQGSVRGARLEPWSVLILSDLGFSSHAPRQIRVSNWDEFFAQNTIQITGSVGDCLSGENGNLFGEYRVDAMSAFSLKKVTAGLPFLRPLSTVVELLRKKAAGEPVSIEQLNRLDLQEVPRKLSGQIARALGASATDTNQGNPVDRILASLDFEESGPTGSESKAATTTDAAVLAARIECSIKQQAEAFMGIPAFTSRKASWSCLRDLVKTAGRSDDPVIMVYSGERDEILDNLAGILEACGPDAAPDLLLWDFPARLTKADIDRLSVLAKTSEQHKCMAVAPLSMGDQLTEDMQSCDTLVPILQQPRYLALKEFCRHASSRCISLFAPGVMLRGDIGSAPDQIVANSVWWFARLWITRVRAGAHPFGVVACDPGEADSLLGNPAVDVRAEIAREAGDAGITVALASRGGGVHVPEIVTMFAASEQAKQYTLFQVNHLINRTMKLAGVAFTRIAAMGGHQESCEMIAGVIVRHLLHYGAITSAQDVSITIEGGRFSVKIDSDVLFSGYPVGFEFEIC